MVELTVLGLSGPLLFFAMATFVTALLIHLGIISGWEAEVFVVGALTGVIALALWKPLKNFQNKGGDLDTSSDMIGLNVPCVDAVSATEGSIRYSGINWTARAAGDAVAAGDICKIVGVDGNVMLVEPLSD